MKYRLFILTLVAAMAVLSVNASPLESDYSNGNGLDPNILKPEFRKEAAEYAANLLEGSEMVPMYKPPTAKIQTWRAMPEAERDAEEIRDFAYELALLLKKWCRIL